MAINKLNDRAIANLKPGDELQIQRRVYRFEPEDMTALAAMSVEELQALREDSIAKETAIFDKLCEDTGAWETQATETMLINLAMEYVKTKTIEHTGNQWRPDGYNNGQEISNAVYKMHHHIYEETKYNRDSKQSVPVAWYLTWAVRTQSAGHYSGSIAGQQRKRFTDKAVMRNTCRAVSKRIPTCSRKYLRPSRRNLPRISR